MSAQLKAVSVVKLAESAAVTANGNGTAVDLVGFDGDLKLILNASATGGAGQTLDVKVQHSANGTTGWADASVAFTQVTNAAASFQELNVTTEQFHRFIRLVDTVGGTTPTVNRGAVLVGRLR